MATMPTTWRTTRSTKLLLGRDPVGGAPQASQPAIPRFENGAGRAALHRVGRESAARVIERIRAAWTGWRIAGVAVAVGRD